MNIKLLNTIVFTFLLWSLIPLNAQDTTLLHYSYLNFDKTISFYEIDSYENIYIVDQNSILTKWDIQGTQNGTFSNGTYGTLSSVNIFNPMKIMLFYKESGIIIFLNEDLVPITQPMSLLEHNFQNISLASFTTANQIILYDPFESKIITLDFYLNEVSKNVLVVDDFEPNWIIPNENHGMVFQDPKNGLLFFDPFGTMEKQLPIITESKVQLFGDVIAYFEKGEWIEYNMNLLQKKQFSIQNFLPSEIVPKNLQKANTHFVGIDQSGKIFVCSKNF
jgi:hypothetical protein